MGINIVIQIPVGLLLAIFLSKGRRGTRFYKAAFFMPVVLSATAVSYTHLIDIKRRTVIPGQLHRIQPLEKAGLIGHLRINFVHR